MFVFGIAMFWASIHKAVRYLNARSREVYPPQVWETFQIALKFDRHLGSNAAEKFVKFQSDVIIITSNLSASRLYEIWR